MSQIEVTKLTQEQLIAAPAGHITVPKVTMFLLLQPGDGGGPDERQVHVFSRKIAR